MEAERASYFGAHRIIDLIRQNQRDAPVDELDNAGRTPLFYATSVEEARFLVLIGVDPEHKDPMGATAVFRVPPKVGRYLVHGPRASYFGARDAMFLTMNKIADADPNEPDAQGRTPLFYAPTVEVAQFLIEQGADPTLVDNTGGSPLFTVPGGTGVVEFLVSQCHLDPNAKNHQGNSVLHTIHDSELLKDVLAAGASPLLVNNAGLNALEFRCVGGVASSAAGSPSTPSSNKPGSGAGQGGPEHEDGIIKQILQGVIGALVELLGFRQHR
jgi:hypothetical protein